MGQLTANGLPLRAAAPSNLPHHPPVQLRCLKIQPGPQSDVFPTGVSWPTRPDCELAVTELVASLKCPLGKMRMSTPMRSEACSHVQCFDAYSCLLGYVECPRGSVGSTRPKLRSWSGCRSCQTELVGSRRSRLGVTSSGADKRAAAQVDCVGSVRSASASAIGCCWIGDSEWKGGKPPLSIIFDRRRATMSCGAEMGRGGSGGSRRLQRTLVAVASKLSEPQQPQTSSACPCCPKTPQSQ
uniref:SP-RING-type domain-containing protein n=1 Tax=Macrostomum lignano TaxID=282301 RepID=A0A1I8F7L0_9PLAT